MIPQNHRNKGPPMLWATQSTHSQTEKTTSRLGLCPVGCICIYYNTGLLTLHILRFRYSTLITKSCIAVCTLQPKHMWLAAEQRTDRSNGKGRVGGNNHRRGSFVTTGLRKLYSGNVSQPLALLGWWQRASNRTNEQRKLETKIYANEQWRIECTLSSLTSGAHNGTRGRMIARLYICEWTNGTQGWKGGT